MEKDSMKDIIMKNHQTAPIYLKNVRESEKLKVVKRKYSELLFRQALETFKEEQQPQS